MAKVVRWKGEFPDIDGNQYTVEIYGESTGVAVKSITLGANPLITEEDDNDDLFTPIRTQTGTLEVLDPYGTLMEEIIPDDTLDRPIIVKRVSDGRVMWQGYISNDTFSQDYTYRDRVVTISVNGMIETMKKICATKPTSPIVSLGNVVRMYGDVLSDLHINYVFHAEQIDGVSFEDYICVYAVSLTEWPTDKHADGSIDMNPRVKPMGDVVPELCRLLNLRMRESGDTIYITGTSDINTIISSDMLRYKGKDHIFSTIAPYGTVVLSAEPDKIETGIRIPDMPRIPSLHMVADSGYRCQSYNYFYEQLQQDTYTNIELKQYHVQSEFYMPTDIEWGPLSSKMGYNRYSLARAKFAGIGEDMYAGAEWVKDWKGDEDKYNKASGNSGIYAIFYSLPTQAIHMFNKPIIRIVNGVSMIFNRGYLKLNMATKVAGFVRRDTGEAWYEKSFENMETFYVMYSLRVGGKYYDRDSRTWMDRITLNYFEMESESNEIYISVSEESLVGEMELCIYPYICNPNQGEKMICELLFKDLSVTYGNEAWYQDNEDANEFVADTGSVSKEEREVKLSYFTDQNNVISNNSLVNPSGKLIGQINGMLLEERLLQDVSLHSRKTRRAIELELSGIETPLPDVLVMIDRKKYIPVSDSVEWFLGRHTVKMIDVD